MARSPLFSRMAQVHRMGRYCEDHGLSARQARERLDDLRWAAERGRWSRRQVLAALGIGAAGLASTSILGARKSHAGGGGGGGGNGQGSSPRVAIVGGGMAGIACADRLERSGVVPVVYEASSRLGGRIRTWRGFPGGLVAEAGGEMIDNLHKTILGYAIELGLAREDLGKNPGDPLYYFGGAHWHEDDIVDEYREMVDRMRPDLQACSGSPTFYSHTAEDVTLDNTDLATYLDARAGDLPRVREALAQAYVSEYGLECAEQSMLNMLLFIHLDSSRNFREFGVFSDERYHLTEGNDQLVLGLAARLAATINTGAKLTRLARDVSGGFLLYFNGSAEAEVADAVVLTLPFSVLRGVDLDASLDLSEDKRRAIDTLGYGANCKTMVLFDGRPWSDLAGSNGLVYSDLPNVQNAWETNYTKAGASGVLTDYSGGDRAKDLQVTGTGYYCGSCHVGPVGDLNIEDSLIQSQVQAFLADLDVIIPGAAARAATEDGKFVVHRGHWLPQSASKGSYTCYAPGQFTQVAGLEGEPAGLLKFAGEHANSFYEWQGFMEGAALSGIDAAEALLDDIRDGRL
ncbi:FAD-dependent oxidoreductase [Myxococcota bacterium]|nr:FAD-dependent oxidoreductase [Myxococcota bacterium]